MPQRFTIARIQRQEVSLSVTGKSESRIRCQHSSTGLSGPNFMAPSDFAGLVVDGFDDPLAPNVIIRACPPVEAIRWLGEVDGIAGMGVHDKQSGFGVEAGGTKVGEAVLVGCNKASIGRRLLGGILNRSAPLIDSQRPVYRSERRGQKVLSVRAV